MTDKPTLRVLSLGAGVQSTTLLLLAAEGRIGPLDAAIFADTGWEPAAVYDHLNRIEHEVAKPAGIPIYRVSTGNIREDALNPDHRFASMPLFIKNPDGGDGMTRRQCSNEYKVVPIKRKVRELLGYVHPTPVPSGVFAEQWIGISRDEFSRAKDSDVRYARNVFPLLDMPGGGGRPGRLDALGLPAPPEGQRLPQHAEECVHRMHVPRKRPVAPHEGRNPGGVGGRRRLRRLDPQGLRARHSERSRPARRGLPAPLPASPERGPDRPRYGTRMEVAARGPVRRRGRCRTRGRRPGRLLALGVPQRNGRRVMTTQPLPIQETPVPYQPDPALVRECARRIIEGQIEEIRDLGQMDIGEMCEDEIVAVQEPLGGWDAPGASDAADALIGAVREDIGRAVITFTWPEAAASASREG